MQWCAVITVLDKTILATMSMVLVIWAAFQDIRMLYVKKVNRMYWNKFWEKNKNNGLKFIFQYMHGFFFCLFFVFLISKGPKI